jgi:DNA-binding CsgD family transcriptional regulator
MRTGREKWGPAFRLVEEGKAKPKVVEAVRLASEGLVLREIGERMGRSTSLVGQLLNDPTYEKTKARKGRYRTPCSKCGHLTSPGGPQKTSGLCIDCRKHRHDERNALLVEMWEAEEPTWYIAEQLGVTEVAVRAYVDALRRVKGRNVPMRRLGGDAEARARRHEQMIGWRREGLTNAEIGERLGTNAAAVSAGFVLLRSRGRDIPPHPDPFAEGGSQAAVTTAEFVEMVRKGLSVAEIAKRTGTGVGSVYARRRRLRAKGVIA